MNRVHQEYNAMRKIAISLMILLGLKYQLHSACEEPFITQIKGPLF